MKHNLHGIVVIKKMGCIWAGFDFPRHKVHFMMMEILSMVQSSFDDINTHFQISPLDFIRLASWRDKIFHYGVKEKVIERQI